MEVPDPAAITGIIAASGALVGAIKVLWDRSEKCLADRERQAERIDKLEDRVYGCPIPTCPNKPQWKPPTHATTSAPRIPNLPPQTS